MPQGKHILGRAPTRRVFGTAKVGDRGQIVIPKNAREIFGIKPGDSLVVLGDEATGLAIMKSDVFLAQVASPIFQGAPVKQQEDWPEPTETMYDDIKALAQTRAEE